MKLILILSYLLLFNSFSYASGGWNRVDVSDFQKAIAEVSSKLQKLESFSVNIIFQSYENEDLNLVHDRQTGFIKRRMQQYHKEMFGILTIQDSVNRIVVDESNKIIAIASAEKTGLVDQLYDSSTIHNLLSDVLIFKKEENHNIIYRLDMGKSGPINSYLISINKDHLITRMNIGYHSDAPGSNGTMSKISLRIDYENWQLDPVFKSDDFNISKYLKNVDKTPALTNTFRDFMLTDQRITSFK